MQLQIISMFIEPRKTNVTFYQKM